MTNAGQPGFSEEHTLREACTGAAAAATRAASAISRVSRLEEAQLRLEQKVILANALASNAIISCRKLMSDRFGYAHSRADSYLDGADSESEYQAQLLKAPLLQSGLAAGDVEAGSVTEDSAHEYPPPHMPVAAEDAEPEDRWLNLGCCRYKVAGEPGLLSPLHDILGTYEIVTSSWLYALFVFLPFAYAAGVLDWGPAAIFCLNFIGLIPQACLLGDVTEDLASRFGDVAGGLMNATFGNIIELALSMSLLRANKMEMVACSLLGSVLSNLLLVMGAAMFVGGMRYKVQDFNLLVNKVSRSLLFCASIVLVFPAIAKYVDAQDFPEPVVVKISHGLAILLIVVYLCYLLFQLKTHARMFIDEAGGAPTLSLVGSVSLLFAVSVSVTIASEYIADAIDGVSHAWHLHQTFIALIVLPMAGNASEHVTTVKLALKNRLDLALNISLGASLQIAIFVVPLVCLISWAMGRSFLLLFDLLTMAVLLCSVVLSYFLTADGFSNWLIGMLMMVTYVAMALPFFFRRVHDDP
ncbi:hypothetical protein WJX72_004425 [[Myrmecia] bisecta]|uniref:Vacuolar cation/proton exchanger n=1 Tax=[Myrmecia] bisecta TaxID=41462 RepID=A0AAW1QF57_9CHLO